MGSFYIYAFFDGAQTLYVGKGTGRRLQKQEKRFGIPGKIVEWVDSEEAAYKREKHWISELRPTENRDAGGRGGWSTKGPHAELDFPNGLTPEGLAHAAPFIAKLLLIWKRDKSLAGILNILGAYIPAHGLEKMSEAVLPHLHNLLIKDLAAENKS